ncbi:proline dehydrogenase family protein [Luteococcus sediminum]
MTPPVADAEVRHPASGVLDLTELADESVATVRRWLTASAAAHRPDPAAERLSAVLSDPTGLDFTVGFVDRVVRTEDLKAAGRTLHQLGSLTPKTMSLLDRAQITSGALFSRGLPQVVVPAARARIRQMVGHMVVDARDQQFGKAVEHLTVDGNRLNINLLGEAVLGQAEADHHLAETVRLLRRPDVDYASIKVSSITSQLSMWGFEETVDQVVARLAPLYLEAARAPRGTKFINLDMEEYRDLRLTIEVFKRLLSLPETKGLEAGIVLQAYLPDALGAMQELAAFGAQRVEEGGAGVKVRLVKGANLAMERVHAEVAGWPVATCDSKQATDANYKLVLHWLLQPENMRGLRIGVAGHNLFDIAFAHLLGERRGVSDRMEFEMLQGMATEQAEAASGDIGRPLLYVPAVRPEEFDVAIAYLVRRLEENSAHENFLSGIFTIAPDNEVFRREERRFRRSVHVLGEALERDGHTAPLPKHRQDRSTEVPAEATDSQLAPFDNEPDTNPALLANQRWAREAVERSTDEAWLAGLPTPQELTLDAVDQVVGITRRAAQQWAARPAAERAQILYRTADILASRRGELVTIAAAEVGKSVQQSDTEISEAIDFARYYAHRALELDEVANASFVPDRCVLVTPPWNFPIAIPAGSTFAALAAGAGVIHKPSKPTPHCSMAVLEALWEAGVPCDLLHGIAPDEGEVGRRLVSHEGVDRIILTGASETAAMFASWRPELRINAETSGKNGIIVTPSADRDLAVADLVTSAFGHAGQKCSAASLGILVGSAYDSERLRRQLVDAASSLVVDWPTNLSAMVGPLTELPSDKLRRALTTLEPGESWLLEPRQLDDSGRLWSPGIKDGVRPGSFFHTTEVFGPVLGLMKARDLDEAIELQNATDFGLTGGIHSLDVDEVRRWLDAVQVGNAYINRGITGAIVQRQPFGGWKKSSVGLGSKAGGPNYLMLMGRWDDATPSGPATRIPGAPAAGEDLSRLLEATGFEQAERDWLDQAAADDVRAWNAEFATARDVTGLASEANIFRYRPAEVVLRASADARAVEVARLLLAAQTAHAELRLSVHPDCVVEVHELVDFAKGELGLRTDVVDDEAFLRQTVNAVAGPKGAPRIRLVGTTPESFRQGLGERPDIALLDDPVTGSGRVELRNWLREQAIAMTLHRFGNPAPRFQELAEQLKR